MTTYPVSAPTCPDGRTAPWRRNYLDSGRWQKVSKRSQRKGRDGKLELARILQGYGYPVEPGQAVSYGATPDLTGLPGIHIECKRAQQQNIYAWLDQARRDADKFHDGLPAVYWSKNRSPWLVVMDLRDWMKLYNER